MSKVLSPKIEVGKMTDGRVIMLLSSDLIDISVQRSGHVHVMLDPDTAHDIFRALEDI